ncbi:uncharacterized protein LOC133891151 [Phragmites australis]|uniref:uncharacterized protein LOC133891151 n=1 Tax=Phragmites australis TaxID=29695 RepID=UPI002D793504|nr:uncharacterized protein LOC133891151 [Phragmites australis]
MPLGQIKLPITFGVPDKFRIEKLTFDVTDFEMAYNVILGCPMLAKFMVVTWTLSVRSVKPPTRARTVSMTSSSSLADTSKSDDATKGEANEDAKDKKNGCDTKAMPLDSSEPTKTARIGVDLDPK